jgi:hypothetical protein
MDEYTADPFQTEREAFRVLRKMNAEKVQDAEAKQKAADARNLAKRFVTEGKSVFGSGAGDLEKGMMGGRMKKPTYRKGGTVSSASKRADGCAIKGKTKGRMI